MMRPLFQAGCSGRRAGRKSMDMAIPPTPKPTLTSDDPTGRPVIERADRRSLFKNVAEVKGSTAALMIEVTDITELWELVSTARHGDGPAVIRLRALNPGLWSHQDVNTQVHYDRVGLRAYSMRVQDSDIERYFDATIAFWDNISRK